MNGPGVHGDPRGTYGREPRAPFGPCPSCHIYHALDKPCPRDTGVGSHVHTCDVCGTPGKPYEYKGQTFDGLTAYHGQRLCSSCTDAAMKNTPLYVTEVEAWGTRTYDINEHTATEETEPPVRAIAAHYRYRDYRPERGRRAQ